MSSFSIPITPKDTVSLLFRIKKFEFNRYKIEHPTVKGFLRVANLPINILNLIESKGLEYMWKQNLKKHINNYN